MNSRIYLPTCPSSFKECFYFDESDLNPTPNGLTRKIIEIYLGGRYSMTALMRLSQYSYIKANTAKGLKKRLYTYMQRLFMRQNLMLHNFEYGANPQIEKGVIFHHSDVCITTKTYIESCVHIYRNVTFGEKNGKAPYIKKGAKIASHSIVLGGITVGEKAIVAPGAMVAKDVPDWKIAAGVPAKIIGDVTDEKYKF